MFKKLAPSQSWGNSSYIAWSVITQNTLESEEESDPLLTRKWLGSFAHQRSTNVEKANKMRQLRDEEGALATRLSGSGIPLVY